MQGFPCSCARPLTMHLIVLAAGLFLGRQMGARWLWMECSFLYLLSTKAHTQQINKYMKKHSIVNLRCPGFLFRYPNLDIPSQALFNLHRASALPLKCGSEDDQNFQSPPGQTRRPVTWCCYLIISVQHSALVWSICTPNRAC